MKVSRATREVPSNTLAKTEPAHDSLLETLPQLVLHFFKVSTANIAEIAQRVLALGGSGLNFLWS